MKTLFILIGIATTYAEPYIGQPLYCDRDGALLYRVPSKSSPSPAQRGRDGVGAMPAWIALDVRQFQIDQARCGDHVVLLFPQGQVLLAQAFDAGPFAGYYVADYPDLPIIADVPSHLWPVHGHSSTVHLLNLSALDRAMEAAHVHLIP